MISAKLYSNTGEEKGTTELPEKIFGEVVNEHAMWLSVRSYLDAQRQGNASVKNRTVIRGGGKKPYRQKGTGHARAGTRRSPIWVGGARAFGPKPRTYRTNLPKKVRRLSIRSALSLAAQEERVIVVGDLSLETPRTKAVVELLGKLGCSDTKCVLVTGGTDRNVVLSGRNLRNVNVTTVEQINTYDLLNADTVIVTEGAVQKLGEARE